MSHLRGSTHATRREQGQAIVLLALLMVALLGLLGLAIDGGGLFFLNRDAQTAVDAALVAATYAKCTAPNPALVDQNRVITAGRTAAEQNGFRDLDANGVSDLSDSVDVLVEPFYTPPEDLIKPYYVKVTVTAVKPSYFIQLIYRDPLVVSASGVSFCEPTRTYLLPFSGIVALSNDAGCSGPNDAAFHISTSTHGRVRVENAGIFVNSPQSCAMRIDGNHDDQLIVDGTCWVVGGTDAHSADVYECDEGPSHPAQPWDLNPFRYVDPPDDACSLPATSVDVPNGGNVTIGPGHYSEIDMGNNSSRLTLTRGVYCIDHLTATGGTITGQGVVLYMPPNNLGIEMRGQLDMHLDAPVEADCAANASVCPWLGLLLWSDANTPGENAGTVTPGAYNGDVHFTGQGSTEWTGLIYAPRSQCRLEGNGTSTGVNTQLVCWGFNLQANGIVYVNYERALFLDNNPDISVVE